MQVCIPSYKRGKDCKTTDWIKSAKLFVHKFEAAEYRTSYQNEVVEIPDEIGGKGMATIRNFIKNYCHENGDDRVLMLDDDIEKFGYFENNEWNVVDEAEFLLFAENAYLMCDELGTKLWGVNVCWDKRFYHENLPMSFGNVVLGPCFGVTWDGGLNFDERLGLKEDYDYSIQCLNKFRKILRFNKYFYVMKHMFSVGGCRGYRNMEREIEQARLLQNK